MIGGGGGGGIYLAKMMASILAIINCLIEHFKFVVSTTPRGQKKLISATTLSKKYDILFHFFHVMPSTWAPALNDFVFTPRVADF